MNFKKIYDAVSADFGDEVALATVQIVTLNLSTKIKAKHLTNASFEDKIIKKAKKLLWAVDSAIVDQAIACWKVAYDWECKQSLQGLGGCEAKSFKQLLAEIELQ